MIASLFSNVLSEALSVSRCSACDDPSTLLAQIPAEHVSLVLNFATTGTIQANIDEKVRPFVFNTQI